MKIAIAGTGYVGLSNAVILAQNHDVVAVDLAAGKVDLINRGLSPIVDPEITDYLATRELSLFGNHRWRFRVCDGRDRRDRYSDQL